MIQIFSMNGDNATDEVMDWLHYQNKSYERINIVEDKDYTEFLINLKSMRDKKIKTGWLRKSGIFTESDQYKFFLQNESFPMNHYFYNELNYFRKLLYSNVTDWLCDPKSASVSKIEVLNTAIALSIDIPETYVVNSKKRLIELFEKYEQRIIVKSIGDLSQIRKNDQYYIPLTTRISEKDISSFPDYFFPSLVQNEIKKDFEIRSFYLEGKFYSSAIFSQLDNQTAVDFRNYNYERPNRVVPFLLPKKIENKLNRLCRMLNINTGSMDLIKGLDGKYYFLEINQNGQFGQVSKPCNYYLEELIANRLKN